MTTKHEWRKHEKSLYLPKPKPQLIDVPAFNFITVNGAGNPNSEEFTDRVTALYSLAYGLKMHLKKLASKPEGYVDFTVYPLEGIWDISDEAKKAFTGVINKNDLVYSLMIRQPDFVTEALFLDVKKEVELKKPSPLLPCVTFNTHTEGSCIQMLHLGPFDDEPQSFSQMEKFADEHQLLRVSKVHREIYLSDARRVSPDKYKTVLRFNVKPKVQ